MSDSKEGSWQETGQAFSNKVRPNSSLWDELQLLSHERTQDFSVFTRPDIVKSEIKQDRYRPVSRLL
jgi:hypothetical protein